MKLIGSLLFVLISGVPALAASLKFQAEQALWICPPGAVYVIIQCKEASRLVEDVVIDMPGDGEGFYYGDWQNVTDGNIHSSVMASRYDNIYTGAAVSLNISVGFETDYKLNNMLFLELDPQTPVKSMLMYGHRKPVKEFEAIPSLILTNVQFQQ